MAHRAVPWLAPLLVLLLAPAARAGDERAVVFVVNDALVKDHPLEGVQVSAARSPGAQDGPAGTTDAQGRVTLRLAPGAWLISYELAGHVPLRETPLEVREDGQEVTTSLLPALEGEAGEGGPPPHRRIALVLNWGSDQSAHVRDMDSHLAFETAHVYFSNKVEYIAGAQLELDVDDVDWGGPETVTVRDPAPGRYVYWVHDWSSGPGQLGSSELVVRLLVGDHVAGEWRAPPTATARVWRPFRALEVSADGVAQVQPFTDEELAAGADRAVPAEVESAVGWRASESGATDDDLAVCCAVFVVLVGALGFATWLIRKALKSTRS